MPNFNGYRWTAFDVLIAIGIVMLLGDFAINELMKVEFSLASVAGIIWGFGTLLFNLSLSTAHIRRLYRAGETEEKKHNIDARRTKDGVRTSPFQ